MMCALCGELGIWRFHASLQLWHLAFNSWEKQLRFYTETAVIHNGQVWAVNLMHCVICVNLDGEGIVRYPPCVTGVPYRRAFDWQKARGVWYGGSYHVLGTQLVGLSGIVELVCDVRDSDLRLCAVRQILRKHYLEIDSCAVRVRSQEQREIWMISFRQQCVYTVGTIPGDLQSNIMCQRDSVPILCPGGMSESLCVHLGIPRIRGHFACADMSLNEQFLLYVTLGTLSNRPQLLIFMLRIVDMHWTMLYCPVYSNSALTAVTLRGGQEVSMPVACTWIEKQWEGSGVCAHLPLLSRDIVELIAKYVVLWSAEVLHACLSNGDHYTVPLSEVVSEWTKCCL